MYLEAGISREISLVDREWLNKWLTDASPEEVNFIQSVEAGTSRLDGVMSSQTVSLRVQLDCDGVDMDMLWAYTPMSWQCPACLRSKSQIARPNKNGDLMCRLVEHHDHMKDHLIKEFEKISAGLDRVLASEAAGKFAKRSAPMVSAYDNTVICNDCNNADAVAKKLAGTHPSFSFSPAEILAFVIASPNAEHKVSSEAATRIWNENRETFNLRMKIVSRIAEIAAKDEHWYQTTPYQFHPDYVRQTAESYASITEARRALRILCGPPRKQNSKAPKEWRAKGVNYRVQIPTAGQIEHVAKVTSYKRWQMVPDDWHCPGCHRSKAQIVRPTKQSAWALPITSKVYRDRSAKYGYSNVFVCDDCGSAAVDIVKEAAAAAGVEAGAYARQIDVDEIAQIILPRPHAIHRIANDKADALVEIIAARLRVSLPLDT